MDQTSDPEAPVWAILELMGHRQLAGRIREVQRFGVTLCQIEMDRGPGEEPVIQFYGGAAIFGVTVTDEVTVRRFQARGAQYAGPVQVPAWRPSLPAPEPAAYPQDLGCTCGARVLDGETHREECALVDESGPLHGMFAPPPSVTAAEPGAAWCEAVDAHVADPDNAPKPGPAPLDALAQFIRETGGLDESPALALVDELSAARSAPW